MDLHACQRVFGEDEGAIAARQGRKQSRRIKEGGSRRQQHNSRIFIVVLYGTGLAAHINVHHSLGMPCEAAEAAVALKRPILTHCTATDERRGKGKEKQRRRRACKGRVTKEGRKEGREEGEEYIQMKLLQRVNTHDSSARLAMECGWLSR